PPGRFGHPPGPGLVDFGEVALAESQVLRRDLEQLVVGEEVQRLLEAQLRGGREPDGDVRCGRTNVGLLLLAADVDADVARPLLDPNDHPLVDLLPWFDESGPPLLRARQTKRQRLAR